MGGTEFGRTKTIKKNFNPVWNETFKFEAEHDTPIVLRIYDWDRGSKDDPVGTQFVQVFQLNGKSGSWKKEEGLRRRIGEYIFEKQRGPDNGLRPKPSTAALCVISANTPGAQKKTFRTLAVYWVGMPICSGTKLCILNHNLI